MFEFFKKKNENEDEIEEVSNIEIDDMERVKGALFGSFVGDALGVPVEFKTREEVRKNKVTKMLEYGSHNQPIGTWSDDSSMVLATMDSICESNGIQYHDMMKRFLEWMDNSKYTANNDVFDIGNTTQESLWRYKDNSSIYLCGAKEEYKNGNGSLMRILPVSIYMHYTNIHLDNMIDVITNISSMTHAHIYSVLSCIIYTVFIDEFLREKDTKTAYLNTQKIIKELIENGKKIASTDEEKTKIYGVFDKLISRDISILDETYIKSTGYVVDSLEASIWCILTTSNYQDAVLKAVNLGGDTDTIGAITGGLAGLIYGYNAIPTDWISVLKRKEYLSEMTTAYISLIEKSKGMYEVQIAAAMPKKEDFPNAKPMLEGNKLKCNIVLTMQEFKSLCMGRGANRSIQGESERWFMYCDLNEKTINYFRTATGNQIYRAYYELEDGKCIINTLEASNNPLIFKKEFHEVHDDEDNHAEYTITTTEIKKDYMVEDLNEVMADFEELIQEDSHRNFN